MVHAVVVLLMLMTSVSFGDGESFLEGFKRRSKKDPNYIGRSIGGINPPADLSTNETSQNEYDHHVMKYPSTLGQFDTDAIAYLYLKHENALLSLISLHNLQQEDLERVKEKLAATKLELLSQLQTEVDKLPSRILASSEAKRWRVEVTEHAKRELKEQLKQEILEELRRDAQ